MCACDKCPFDRVADLNRYVLGCELESAQADRDLDCGGIKYKRLSAIKTRVRITSAAMLLHTDLPPMELAVRARGALAKRCTVLPIV